MRKIIISICCTVCISLTAQISPPPSFQRSSITTTPPKINSRKGTLIEKKVSTLIKFKSLNLQKITTKDLSDNSIETVLGIMYEYETYDEISRKTLTLEKKELGNLILSLQKLEQKEHEKIDQETKYKFVTLNNIEFGGIYNESQTRWINYIKFPSGSYGRSLNEFTREELKELIKTLKNAEQEL
ncbi:hypothetical protein C1631_002980 [Chryseobacterium phosphatilyticum]|uniref:Uncharacterized protein n=1 Tax=Chryseobacterium phosphatilyticum TaxID=475075 RepID=A0A316XHE5_9FLAO|nr:hypothetical protein [Chryseobacterium phosphatilyticum]PWN71603.1 hypothetical protein C1631_002980 [Chryseobacterium phosphatilyticum]